MRSTVATLFSLSLAGCTIEHTVLVDGGDSSSQVRINANPTGSIRVPSLCDRTELDQRVTTTGADSFAFAWTGMGYLLVYVGLDDKNPYVVHLSDTGAMLEQPLVIDDAIGNGTLPVVIPSATGFIVAWSSGIENGKGSVQVHALDLSGRPTGATQTIATGRSPQMRPSLSSSPDGVVVSWMDQVAQGDSEALGTTSTFIARLDDDLRIDPDVAPRQVSAGSNVGFPWLAGDASRLSLLWSAQTASVVDVYFSALDSSLLPMNGADIRGGVAASSALLGRLALTDFGHLAAWEDLRSGEDEIYMSLLDPNGMRFAGGLVEEPNTGDASWPHIAWTGSTAGIVYYQFRNGRPQAFMTFLDHTGARIGGAADAQISNSPATAKVPDIAWNGSGFAVLWLDTRDARPEVYFNLVACARPSPI